MLDSAHYVRGKSLHTSQMAHQTGAYPAFCSISDYEYFYSRLYGILVHQRVTLSI